MLLLSGSLQRVYGLPLTLKALESLLQDWEQVGLNDLWIVGGIAPGSVCRLDFGSSGNSSWRGCQNPSHLSGGGGSSLGEMTISRNKKSRSRANLCIAKCKTITSPLPGIFIVAVTATRKARPYLARPGLAWPGLAYPGLARPDQAWPDQAWHGKATSGQARPGKAWPGQALPGQALPGLAASPPSPPPPENIDMLRLALYTLRDCGVFLSSGCLVQDVMFLCR